MKLSKILIALAVAAGFATSSFAETAAPAEPVKAEAAKPAVKKHHHKAKKAKKAEAKAEEAAK